MSVLILSPIAAALLLAQTQDAPRDPLSALPPQTGDPRATDRERGTVPPPIAAQPAPLPQSSPPPSFQPGGEGASVARPPRLTETAPERLPLPDSNPLAVNMADDPVLRLARSSSDPAQFRALVGQAVDASPRVAEAGAGIAEAEAAQEEARAGRYPTIDVGFNGQQSIIRNFDDDPDVIVERARGQSRVDATINAEQTVFDFGATENRITAAGARLRAASLSAEAEADEVALRAIAAWYDVFAYRALVQLAEAFTANQTDLRTAIRERIRLGVSAQGDLPRVESYIANGQADLARYRRQLANAEARFEEMYGSPAPPGLNRAPVLSGGAVSKESALLLARSTPAVASAEAAARAARQDARAQRASTYPRVSAGVDAGRYGVFEGDNYDVRGRFTIRQRLLGGVDARVEQFEARATATEARAARVREESEREAAIALTDVRALEQQLAALQDSYIASRRSRDVLAERFRVARGTLFDLLDSETSYFAVAATYIRTITELDAARYVLLSRTGQLLPTLEISPPAQEDQ